MSSTFLGAYRVELETGAVHVNDTENAYRRGDPSIVLPRLGLRVEVARSDAGPVTRIVDASGGVRTR